MAFPEDDSIQISVILPVYNAESEVSLKLSELHHFLSSNFKTFEIIAVDDGSSDNSFSKITSLDLTGLTALKNESNLGKGAAIKKGVSQAQGACIVFTDIDLPYDLKALKLMHSLVTERKFQMILGDRTLPGSNYLEQLEVTRKLGSIILRNVVRLVLTGEVYDTQCGLKAFERSFAKALFKLMRVHGFAFDIELIYLALKSHADIKKIPVRFTPSDTSSVRVLTHGTKVALDILQIISNSYSGKYDFSELQELTSINYWSD